MGNENYSFDKIKEEYLKSYIYEKDFKVKAQIKSQIYYNKNNNKQKILMLDKTFFVKNEIENYIHNLKQIINLQKDYILKLNILSTKMESNICQDVYMSCVTTEIYENKNLENDIKRKSLMGKDDKRFYLEDEIWYLINIWNTFCNDFFNLSIYHKDIQPKNIYITNEGEFKIFNSTNVLGYESNYNYILENKLNYCALSPNQIEGIKRFKIKVDENLEKSEMFSIGITILCMISLKNITAFYDFINYDIDFYKIKKKLNNSLKIGYSKDLINLLERMLKERENERIGIKELNEELKNKRSLSRLTTCSWMIE